MRPRKKVFLTAVLAALTAVTALAQTDGENGSQAARKSNALFGGGVSAGFSDNYSHVTVAPEIAWPVGKHLYLGTGLLAGWYNTNGENAWSLGVNPYARFHAEVISGFHLFADADLNVQRTQYSGGGKPVIYLDCGIRPGLMIPVAGNAFAIIQVGFFGYESARSNGELWSRTGWRCDSSDIRIGGYFRL